MRQSRSWCMWLSSKSKIDEITLGTTISRRKKITSTG